MTAFFDTSVLVAASLRGHPHHVAALAAVSSVIRGEYKGVLAAHSLAEAYAVLTRMPVRPAIHPSEARRILEENFVRHFDAVSLRLEEYREVLRDMADAGWIGGLIYDALLLRCARKKPCERIYTLNVAHFQKLASDLSDRICAP